MRYIALILSLTAAACSSKPVIEPLQLEGNLLTINNRSGSDWSGVDVWLNRNHRVMMAKIPDGARVQVPLDVFVAGFGQRFNYHRTQVTDVRLTAKLPDGKSIEVIKPFTRGGLAGAFGGTR